MACIDGVEVMSVDVVFDGERDIKEEYVFGALMIKCNGREYILDATKTFWSYENNHSTVECHLEKDAITFNKCKYDITYADLMFRELDVTLYVGGTFSNTLKGINMFLRFGNTKNEHTLKVIGVKQE